MLLEVQVWFTVRNSNNENKQLFVFTHTQRPVHAHTHLISALKTKTAIGITYSVNFFFFSSSVFLHELYNHAADCNYQHRYNYHHCGNHSNHHHHVEDKAVECVCRVIRFLSLSVE